MTFVLTIQANLGIYILRSPLLLHGLTKVAARHLLLVDVVPRMHNPKRLLKALISRLLHQEYRSTRKMTQLVVVTIVGVVILFGVLGFFYHRSKGGSSIGSHV